MAVSQRTGSYPATLREEAPKKGGMVKTIMIAVCFRNDRFNLVSDLSKFPRQRLETVIDHLC